MKKDKESFNSSFTKKWFYAAVAFGIAFAIITTFIAICRNTNQNSTSSILDDDFIETERKKTDIEKSQEEFKEVSNASQKEKKSDNLKPESEQNQTTKEKNKKIKFIKPAQGSILTKHSNGELVKWKTLGEWRTHDGVDLKVKKNTPVKSVADGTISDIKNEEGTWGVCITVTHNNGFQSVYKGLSDQIQVKLDQKVKAGDVIGLVGKTNKIEGDLKEHLHFMLSKDNFWVDPADYIEF